MQYTMSAIKRMHAAASRSSEMQIARIEQMHEKICKHGVRACYDDTQVCRCGEVGARDMYYG